MVDSYECQWNPYTTRLLPDPAAALQLIKPITWFPPMWAFSAARCRPAASPGGRLGLVLLGVLLAGPVVCGMSQAANDWCDRHVDAINEPDRPIPSGRMPGRWGLWIAWPMTALALAARLRCSGPGASAPPCVGGAGAWAYSAEPLRLKRSGWLRAGAGRALLRGAALVHRRGGPGRRRAVLADRRRGAALRARARTGS